MGWDLNRGKKVIFLFSFELYERTQEKGKIKGEGE